MVEFALAVSYLPVGLGRAKARPFFSLSRFFKGFAGHLVSPMKALRDKLAKPECARRLPGVRRGRRRRTGNHFRLLIGAGMTLVTTNPTSAGFAVARFKLPDLRNTIPGVNGQKAGSLGCFAGFVAPAWNMSAGANQPRAFCVSTPDSRSHGLRSQRPNVRFGSMWGWP